MAKRAAAAKAGKKVVIIGAGVGGLSAAGRLAHQGFDVEVYEKGHEAGGRCGRIVQGGFQFDLGPTLLLMPEVLDATFAAMGKRRADYLTLHRCDPNYRIHFRDGSEVTFSTELTRMQEELERMEPGSFRRYLAFLAQGKLQYETSVKHFVGRNYDGVASFFSPQSLSKVFSVRAHKKMYPEVARYFQDERLRAALTFQTMYLGISPYQAPAVYGLLPFTELAMGIWFPEGGMHALPRALEQAAREEGVRFHYRAEVKRIRVEGGKARGVTMADGSSVDADIVLCNADLPWAYRNLLGAEDTQLPREKKLRYTSSTYMLYLGLRRQLSGLLHHNVVFGKDYEGSFHDLFEKKVVPEDPSFYLNVPNRTDPSLAPPGGDALYVLVPVPDRSAGLDWSVEGPKVRAKVFARLAELGMPDVEQHLVVERTFTPDDWALSLNLERGSAFGLSHNFLQVGPFRPANQDRQLRNLFFVGASTQPGTGLPMVLLSAGLVTERIVAHAQGARFAADESPPAPAAPVSPSGVAA